MTYFIKKELSGNSLLLPDFPQPIEIFAYDYIDYKLKS